VTFVLVGSVALQAYGLDVSPGDLDITPSVDTPNLRALSRVLRTLEAQLNPQGPVGRWERDVHGEAKWVSEPLTPEVKAARLAWAPKPSDLKTLDHLFHTRYGNLDVVPTLLGSYDDLKRRAVRKELHGHEVWVAHVDTLLAGLTVPRRKKDAERVRSLRQLQESLG
jgi:hypothetical protein